MKKKLLIFHPSVATYRIDFFNMLSDRFETRLCLSSRTGDGKSFMASGTLERLNVSPVFPSEGGSWTIASIWRQIKEFAPDVVLTPEVGLATMAVVLYRKLHNSGFRIVTMVDDSYNMLVGNNQFSRKHALAEKILLPCVDRIITADSRVNGIFDSRYGEKSVCFPIVPDEVGLRKEYEASAPLAEQYRRDYDLEGKTVILFVGRLVGLKNLHRAISAFGKVMRDDIRFVIVGDGEERASLEALAVSDSRVKFVGQCEGRSLHAWFVLADIFILPSYQEAFGAVTAEALAAGCFCLVSSNAGSSSLVKPGVNGLTFNPMDEGGIANAILSALKKADCRRPLLPLRPCGLEESFRTLSDRLAEPRKKVLFIMHMPPPVHGAAVMGKAIHDSHLVNSAFECHYMNLTFAKSIDDLSKPSLGKLAGTIAFMSRLRRELRRFSPDLVYVTPNSFGPAFFKEYCIVRLLQRRHCDILLHFHNKGISTRQNAFPYRFLYPRFFRNVKVMLLSERLYPDLSRYVPRENVMICPNGIPDCCIRDHAVNDTVPHLLFLSNLYVAKGIDILLDTCAVLKKKGYRFICDIAGAQTPDYDESGLNARLRALDISDCVSYKGSVYGKDKDRLLSAASVFVFPSLNEAFSLVVLEAMSHSLPVIASDQGGIPDMVRDGENGFVVGTGSAADYAARIALLLDNPDRALEMGACGRRLYEESYTLEFFEKNITACLGNA